MPFCHLVVVSVCADVGGWGVQRGDIKVIHWTVGATSSNDSC